jgi:thiol-disulfide isomerase/thioredoxin
MKFLLSILFVWMFLTNANSQSYSLQARVNGYDGKRAYLMQFKGDQQAVIDSTASLDGLFSFQFSEKVKPGVYRVILGSKGSSNFFDEDPPYFDFIYNLENIVLSTSFSSPVFGMKISQSKENDIYYRFLVANEIFQAKMNRITPLFVIYKPEDNFYTALNQEFVNVQSSFSQYTETLSEELPGSIASSVINMSRFPEIKNAGSPEEIKNFVREHFFDLISFSDERLINSPYIKKTVLDYLGLFRDQSLDQSQQEERFISGIDQVMETVSGNPVIYDFVLNFLVDGFQRFQMEKVLVHIAENYIEGGCETDSKKLLQKRLEGYEKMSPGKKAPDILNFDQNGIQVSLYDLHNEYTLVLFWASWCPHCTSFLKQLNTWYPNRKIDLEVFAVSIDSSKFAWEEKVMMDNYPWINTFSGAGWDGKAPKDYNVYATPTLFLLDWEHKIIGKPMTFREFKKEVDALAEKEVKN